MNQSKNSTVETSSSRRKPMHQVTSPYNGFTYYGYRKKITCTFHRPRIKSQTLNPQVANRSAKENLVCARRNRDYQNLFWGGRVYLYTITRIPFIDKKSKVKHSWRYPTNFQYLTCEVLPLPSWLMLTSKVIRTNHEIRRLRYCSHFLCPRHCGY